MQPSDIVELLMQAADCGKQAINAYTDSDGSIESVNKPDGSPLTNVDLASQEAVCSFLRDHFAGVPILSEEGNAIRTDIDKGHRLVVDPLDGTINFTRAIPFYSVTVAYVADGIVQAGVVMPVCHDRCYAAVKDSFSAVIDGDGNRTPLRCSNRSLQESILCVTCDHSNAAGQRQWWQWLRKLRPPTCFRLRSVESSALELCWLAEGKIDGYLHPTDKPWDMAAAGLIVQEAGGKLFDVDGGKWSPCSEGVVAVNSRLTESIWKILPEPAQELKE